MHLRSRQAARLLLASALGPAVLAGCSSSSSGGSPATAPAASSETFHHVTPRANVLIQKNLALLPGVASVTYQNGDLVVHFKSTAVKSDQSIVEEFVHQDEQAASSMPSPSHSSKKK